MRFVPKGAATGIPGEETASKDKIFASIIGRWRVTVNRRAAAATGARVPVAQLSRPVFTISGAFFHDMNASSTEQYASSSDDQTRDIGRKLASRLRPGDLILLHGDLGAGKTTFVQGVAQALQAPEAVTSPTFVLIIEHQSEPPLLHLDAYRLENLDHAALQDAGVYDFLERPDAVKCIEWPERIAAILPPPRFQVTLQHSGDASRHITIVEGKSPS
jgi:tRNA threonylcarbamoyladenosine biosynthesis protein TsaE